MSEELAKTLRQLHVELTNLPRLDAATLDSLRTLAGDIQKVIDSQTQEDADEPSDANAGTLSERIEALVNDFEAHHPQLTKTLSMIAERLSDMGI
jgi:hypothetical protein